MPIPSIPDVKVADAKQLAAIMREELSWLPEGGTTWHIMTRAIALLDPPRAPERPFNPSSELDVHLATKPIATNLSTPGDTDA